MSFFIRVFRGVRSRLFSTYKYLRRLFRDLRHGLYYGLI